MSLYTPESLIRKLIMEAEDLTLTPSPDAASVGGSTPEEIAARSTAAAPAEGGMGGGQSLTLPQVQQPAATISKTVINKEIILSQLASLKGTITTSEKQFEGDDLTPEDANVKLSELLSILIFHVNKFNDFMNYGGSAEPAGEEPLVQPEMPQV